MGDSYSRTAQERFPHLVDGSNRGLKEEGSTPIPNYGQLAGKALEGIGSAISKSEEQQKAGPLTSDTRNAGTSVDTSKIDAEQANSAAAGRQRYRGLLSGK